MQLPQIINSLLENDMYKFSMGQCIYHQFSAYKTTWTFKCRNTDVFFTTEMVEEIKAQENSDVTDNFHSVSRWNTCYAVVGSIG